MHTSTRLHLGIRALLALLLTLALLPLLRPAPAHAAAFIVTTLDDSGPGSLREMIGQANAQTGADTITFTLSGTIVLASTLPPIVDDLTIDGTGHSITISGNKAVRVMVVNSGTLELNVLTIADGLCSNCSGGGIFNNGGTVNINHSTFSENSAACSPDCATNGGAIVNVQGALNVSNSTFSGNSATRNGGGIANNVGSVTVSNSTFSDNSTDNGGGIHNFFGSVTVRNSTFSGNSADKGGGIANNVGSVTVSNSIIANSPSGGNCNGSFTDGGGNISFPDQTCPGMNADPKLDPNGLQDNGGPTQTIALLADSPAIGAIPTANCAMATDQRGIARPQGSACDIGAFEIQVADQTPPQIIPSISGTAGSNSWYVSDVAVTWSVVDSESAITSTTDCDTQSVISDTTGVTFTCKANSAGGTSSQSVTIKRDATAPTISFAGRTAPNAAGWNNNPVTVNWTCSDATSGALSASVSQIVSAEGTNQPATGTCADNAGNTANDAQTGINIDLTAPTLVPSVSPNPIILGGSVTVSAGAADVLSGLASQSCDALDTTSVGTKTMTCTATDNAGNTANASVTYQVVYNWSGFFQPIDNLPTVNSVKAGQAVPVKFSLGGNHGLNIFASGYPKVQQIACGSGTATDEVEQTVTAGASGLSYDAATGQYSYTWKTDKKWTGSCRQLVVRLIDGSEHIVGFQFR